MEYLLSLILILYLYLSFHGSFVRVLLQATSTFLWEKIKYNQENQSSKGCLLKNGSTSCGTHQVVFIVVPVLDSNPWCNLCPKESGSLFTGCLCIPGVKGVHHPIALWRRCLEEHTGNQTCICSSMLGARGQCGLKYSEKICSQWELSAGRGAETTERLGPFLESH